MPTLVAAGIAKTDFRKFVLVCISAEVPKVLIIVLIGYFFGRFYKIINLYFKDFVTVAFFILVLSVIMFLIFKKIKLKLRNIKL